MMSCVPALRWGETQRQRKREMWYAMLPSAVGLNKDGVSLQGKAFFPNYDCLASHGQRPYKNEHNAK